MVSEGSLEFSTVLCLGAGIAAAVASLSLAEPWGCAVVLELLDFFLRLLCLRLEASAGKCLERRCWLRLMVDCRGMGKVEQSLAQVQVQREPKEKGGVRIQRASGLFLLLF
jgi:hypothetical protein